MRGVTLPLIVVLITTTTASAQYSQGLRDRDPDIAEAKGITAEYQQANFHYDWVYLISRFRISDAGYSTTFSLPTAATADQISFGVEAPHRLYLVPRKKTIFSVEVVPSYMFFRDGSGQFDYTARADAHLIFNHLYLDFYANLKNRIQAHVADFNRLATLAEDEYGVGGEFKYSSRTSAVFAVRHRETAYPEDRFQPNDVILELLERSEDTARVSLHHKTFAVTSTLIAAEVSDYDFDNVAANANRRVYVSGGLIRDAGRTTIRAEGGPLRMEFDDPSREDYSGFGASLDATRTNGRWTYNGKAAKDVGFSVFANNPIYETTTGSVGVNYVATRRLGLRGIVAVERDEYPNPVQGSYRTDDIFYAGTGFTYAVWKLGAGLDVGWFERSTTFGGDEDSGIRWGLHLSLTL